MSENIPSFDILKVILTCGHALPIYQRIICAHLVDEAKIKNSLYVVGRYKFLGIMTTFMPSSITSRHYPPSRTIFVYHNCQETVLRCIPATTWLVDDDDDASTVVQLGPVSHHTTTWTSRRRNSIGGIPGVIMLAASSIGVNIVCASI